MNTSQCFICTTCGTQYAPSAEAPSRCTLCVDPRQYVPVTGQNWTTLTKLQITHDNVYRRLQPGLYAIATRPDFGIGQRALLVRTPGGNVLWDCIALIDDATVDIVRAFGGLSAIAVSHPHYYTTIVEWARAFDCPVWLHEDDRQWVMREDRSITHWSGDTACPFADLTLIRLGGHFEGGTVLHWPGGNGGRGTLLSGDILQVVPDRRHVSFMWSYPNYLPLPAFRLEEMSARLAAFDYDGVYGAFWNAEITDGGKSAVAESFRRYLSMLKRGTLD
ncbi:MAG: MBL fold metallo-hydrolase [Gammaproteobacteria bacterium]